MQYCPLLQAEARKYPNAQIVWCQEESKNAGAWSYVKPRIETAMRAARKVIISCLVPPGDRVCINLCPCHKVNPSYAGRKPAAATATGSPAVHAVEQAELLGKALA